MSRMGVIDFETTGMSPGMGDRATEVAIVITEQGRVVDRFQSLMNAGVHIPSFITGLTGISNAMVASAPAAEVVMSDAARFVGSTPLVAHNAAFDRKFWQAELARAGLPAQHAFACTLLLSRRLYPQSPNHKLGTLVDLHHLPRMGAAHRALADAEMTVGLLHQIQHDLRQRHHVSQPDHGLLMALQRCAKAAVPAFMRSQASAPA